jgi:ABC-type glycerol-3-phosphate transport system substrate-binding protein
MALSPSDVALLHIGPTFGWMDRSSFINAKQKVLFPGGDTGVRQSLFWFSDAELPEEAALRGMILGGTEQSGPASHGSFKSFAATAKDAIFSPGSFTMMKPDVENIERTAAVGPLFGNYAWLRGVQRTGRRDYRPLIYPLGHGYAMPVSILSGGVTGTGATADKARDFLVWLLSPQNQKLLSNATGYMAVNFNAADLDLNSKGARDAAIGAARIVLVQPEPTPGTAAESWGSLLGRILAAPSEWQRVLAERTGP